MTNASSMKSRKNLIYSIITEVMILALGIIVPRIVIVSYGSEVNGLLSLTNEILAYLALFEAGLGQVMLNAFYQKFAICDRLGVSSVYNAGKKYYQRISTYYSAALLILSVLFSLIPRTNIDRTTIFFVVLFSGISSVLSLLFISSVKNLLLADGNYYFISIVNLLVKILTYGVTIISAVMQLEIVYIKVLCIAVTLLQVLGYNILLKRKYGWIDKNAVAKLDHIEERKFFFIHQVSSLLFSCTDILLLTVFADLKVVSIYTVYNTIFAAVATVMAAISSSLLHRLGQTYSLGINSYLRTHDAVKLLYISCSYILLTICCIIVTPFMDIYLSGADVTYSSPMLALLFCLVGLLNSNRRIDNNLASISHKVKETTKHAVIEAIINLVVSCILIRPLKIYGVLIGTIIAIFYRSIVAPFYSEKVILKRSAVNGYKYAILNWIIFLMFYTTNKFIVIQITGYLDFAIYSIVTSVIVAFVYILINTMVFRRETRDIVSLIK